MQIAFLIGAQSNSSNKGGTMSGVEEAMIEMARRRFHTIYPCSYRHSLEECFTVVGEKQVLWFNTEDHSTHVVTSDELDRETW